MKGQYWSMLGIAIALATVPITHAAEPDLQWKIDELARQVEELKLQAAKVAELSQQVEELKQQAAQSQQMQAQQPAAQSPADYMASNSRVHLAGYASVGYTDAEGDTGRFDQVQLSPIFHYLYKDLALLEAELEFSQSPEGDTETELEYATIDIFAHDYATLFGGKFLSPLGNFRQNLHPSWINKLPSAPVGFGHDGAAPSSDVGIGVRGGFPIGTRWRGNYALYVSNGPTLVTEEEDGETEFVIEAEGSTSDADGNKVFGGRIGLLPPVDSTEFAFSVATGKVGTAEEDDLTELFDDEPDRDYSVLGADFVYHYNPKLEFLGEYIRQRVDSDSRSARHPSSLTWSAAYLQVSYQLRDTPWETVLRWGRVDTPNDDQDQDQWALGLNYLFAANVIGKLAYEFNRFDSSEVPDDDAFMAQLAFGF